MKSNSALFVYLSANRFDITWKICTIIFERETTKYASVILHIKALSWKVALSAKAKQYSHVFGYYVAKYIWYKY